MMDVSDSMTAEKVSLYHNKGKDGVWHGKGAAELGLVGSVTAVEFERLLNGQHPTTGIQLIQWRSLPVIEAPAEPLWKTDAAAWREKIGEVYLASLPGGAPVVGKAADAQRKTSGKTVGSAPQYTENQKLLIKINEEAKEIYRENFHSEAGEGVRKYLLARGITPQTAAEFGLGLSLSENQMLSQLGHYGEENLIAAGLVGKSESGQLYDRFRGRLMFPLADEVGNTIAFAGRKSDKTINGPKYINSSDTAIYTKGEVLYNAHRAALAAKEAGQVVLVEGYLDAIAHSVAGTKGVVATGGTSLSPQQATALADMAPRAVINRDNDEAGKRAIRRDAKILLDAGLDVSVLGFGAYKDAAEVLQKAGKDYLETYTAQMPDTLFDWTKEQAIQAILDKVPEESREEWRKDIESGQLGTDIGKQELLDLLADVNPAHRAQVLERWAAHLNVPLVPEPKAEKAAYREHRAAWDITFNAPKSVSATGIIGGDEGVREAHDIAVLAAADVIERYCQARTGAHTAEYTGKWIAARFDHDRARPVAGYAAPHYGTHLVLMNMTEDSRGKARSLQTDNIPGGPGLSIFQVQELGTAVYQNVLEHELLKRGYETERIAVQEENKKGAKQWAPEIKGYTQEFLKALSPQSERIKKTLEEKGLQGRQAAVNVAHQDRDKKSELSPEELRKMDLHIAAVHGNQPQRVVRARGRERHEMAHPDKLAEEAVDWAKWNLGENSATFGNTEVLRDAMRYVRGRVPVTQITAEIERQLADGRLLVAEHVHGCGPSAQYKTPEMEAIERRNIEVVLARRDQGWATVPGLTEADIAAQFGNHSATQRRVILQALSTEDQVFGIQGYAGATKTSCMAAIREVAAENGYEVRGLGPSSQATSALMEAGISSENIQLYLMKSNPPAPVKPRLWIIDELSQVSSKQFHDFLITAEKKDRVLVVGDTRQHDSVGAGRAFDQLQKAGMRKATLNKILRQKNEEVRQVVISLAKGNAVEAVTAMREQGRVHEEPDRGKLFSDLARVYAENPDITGAVCSDNKSRNEIDDAVRSTLKARGLVGSEDHEESVLRSKPMTAAERTRAMCYRPGDELRYLAGSKKKGIERKSYAQVIRVEPDKNLLTVKTAKGKVIRYDPKQLSGVAVYDPTHQKFSVGDKIQFTAPWTEQKLANRTMAKITYMDQAGNIRAKVIKTGQEVSWNVQDNRHFALGYTRTSHSFQSGSEKIVLVYGDTKQRVEMENLKKAYVSVSRAVDDVQVFTDSAAKLAKVWSREYENTTALSEDQVLRMSAGASMGM
jgi:DNA primase catalytic core